MKRTIVFSIVISLIFILQGCCSLNLPYAGDFKCAGNGLAVNTDRFILELPTDTTGLDLPKLMNSVFEGGVTYEYCPCGNSNLLMVLLNKPLKSKGKLLTAVTAIKERGNMNSDPLLIFDVDNQYENLPQSAAGASTPDSKIIEYISENTSNTVLAVFDSGLNPDEYSGEKILMKNPSGIQGINLNIPSTGYNFVSKNQDIKDIDVNSHGTFVTNKIIEDLETANRSLEYQILPIKIAENQKVSYWNLLCALEYAKEIQDNSGKSIKIMNMSLGFEIKKNKLGLKRFLGIFNIGNVFTEPMSIFNESINSFSKNALVVASAGNDGVNVDNSKKSEYYPTLFNSENLIVVGGLGPEGIELDKRSNYGNKSVDIAVPFEYQTDNQKIGGTSFGAAKVSSSLTKYLLREPNADLLQLKRNFLQNAAQSDKLERFVLDKRYEQ